MFASEKTVYKYNQLYRECIPPPTLTKGKELVWY